MKLETIQESINTAMKTHATLEVETLRSVVAAVKKAAIDKRCEITEELVDEILLKEQKIIQEMIDTCPKERNDLLEQYNCKMKIINSYAPQLMTDPNNIHYVILKILTDAGVDYHDANKGTIMKTIMPSLKGKADMSIVNKVVTELMSDTDNSMR